ncbi:MAG: DUF4388 domain-containing protein [Acidobacteria bacterium]|nr:DUF4388 domain-containing protein [Acidobacteriota bacterium]
MSTTDNALEIKHHNGEFQLSGHIDRFPLVGVIQFINIAEKTGELRITHTRSDNRCSLFFLEGRLVHAQVNEMDGANAFEVILDWGEGEFRFISAVEAPRHSIDKPLPMLLESHKRLRKLRRESTHLPEDNTNLFIVSVVENVPPISSPEWQILSLVNGRRTIGQICQKTGDEDQTKTLLRSLFSKGLISTTATVLKWQTLIPVRQSDREAGSERPYPPLLRTNLVLNAIDGLMNLEQLNRKLNIPENDLLEDIRLLVETKWIRFSSQDTKVFEDLRKDL